MGNKNNEGEAMQKILDDKLKQLDNLTVKNNVYQMIILDEMQNPTFMQNIMHTFENKYNNYMNLMAADFNGSKDYIQKTNNVNIINIIFYYETMKVNVVTPTNFKCKNIYYTSLNKLNDRKIQFMDINNLFFRFNATDISNFFVNNLEFKETKIPDQGVIEVLRKNNVTISDDTPK